MCSVMLCDGGCPEQHERPAVTALGDNPSELRQLLQLHGETARVNCANCSNCTEKLPELPDDTTRTTRAVAAAASLSLRFYSGSFVRC